jgi:hypothetical protein
MRRQLLVACCVVLVCLVVAACPGRVEIVDGRIVVREIELPSSCRILEVRVVVEQGSVRQVVQGRAVERSGDLDLGPLSGFDLTRRLTVLVVVSQAVGDCDPFEIGQRFRFVGTLTDTGTDDAGSRVFTVPFSELEEVE